MIRIKNQKNSGIHIGENGGTKVHDKLRNLDFEHSGHTGFQKELTFDDTPSFGSNNPVKSGGVYSVLSNKQASTDNTLQTTDKTVAGAINEVKGVADAKYTKPQTGIPESHLAQDVQEKLNDDLAKRLEMYGKDIMPTTTYLSFSYISAVDAYRVYVSGEEDENEVSDKNRISGDIVIPYEIDAGSGLKPVYALGDFTDCSNITTITMPRSITLINGNSFRRCSSLKYIEFPDSLTNLGGGGGGDMFLGCTVITDVIIPDSVTTINSSSVFGNFSSRPSGLVVYCNKGSYIHTYCKTNNVPYKLKNTSTYIDRSSWSSGTTMTLVDGGNYYFTNVGTLTLTYPSDTHWSASVNITTKSSGTVSITFPQGTSFIGVAPNFSNSETWEISIRDGVVVAGKVVSGS